MALQEEVRLTKSCTYCGETILDVAIKCKHCGSKLAKPKYLNKVETASRASFNGLKRALNRRGAVTSIVVAMVAGYSLWLALPGLIDVVKLSNVEYMTVSDFPGNRSVKIDVPVTAESNSLRSNGRSLTETLRSGGNVLAYDVTSWKFITRNPINGGLLTSINVTVRPNGLAYWRDYFQREGVSVEELTENHGDLVFVVLKGQFMSCYFHESVGAESTFMVQIEGVSGSTISRPAYDKVVDRMLASLKES